MKYELQTEVIHIVYGTVNLLKIYFVKNHFGIILINNNSILYSVMMNLLLILEKSAICVLNKFRYCCIIEMQN